MPPRLMPPNRGTDAHTEALRRLVSRGSLVDRFNHTHPQICRIWLGHGAFQKPNRPPRLGLSEPLGSPDSIPTETALRSRITSGREITHAKDKVLRFEGNACSVCVSDRDLR